MDLCPSEIQEIWRPIPQYEGLYDASNLGRIRSSPGKTTSNIRYSRRVWQSRIMRPKYPRHHKRQDGRITLWKDGTAKDHLVSRLVASAWIGTPANGMTVNHIDGDYKNNMASNLEWVTLAENIKKGFEGGLFVSIQNPVELLSIDGISRRFSSMSEASRWLGRSHGYISKAIKKGKTTVTSTGGDKYSVSF